MEIQSIEEISKKLNIIRDKWERFSAVILIGAGFFGGGGGACEELQKIGKDVVLVCDNDGSKHTERYWCDKKGRWVACKSVKSILDVNQECLCLIATNIYYKELAEQLQELGIKNYESYDQYIKSMNGEEIKQCYKLLRREVSKHTLCALLQAGLEHNDEYYKEIMRGDQYFGMPEFLEIHASEIMLEAGAYVGDVIEKYIWKRNGYFKRIHAFEPGKKQYVAMQNRVKRLEKEWGIKPGKICLYNCAVGSEKGIIKIRQDEEDLANTHTVIENRTDEELLEVQVESVDTYLNKKEPISFVIADVEGDERKLLEGMKHAIIQNKPKMAISVYHKPNDIWEIMKLIKSYREDYIFDMLHHSTVSAETVLYCY